MAKIQANGAKHTTDYECEWRLQYECDDDDDDKREIENLLFTISRAPHIHSFRLVQ